MTRQEIEEIVRNFLTVDFEVPEDRVYPEARLREDLEIDSLDFVQVIVFLHKSFGFKPKDGEMTHLKTLSQFCDYIEEKVNQK